MSGIGCMTAYICRRFLSLGRKALSKRELRALSSAWHGIPLSGTLVVVVCMYRFPLYYKKNWKFRFFRVT